MRIQSHCQYRSRIAPCSRKKQDAGCALTAEQEHSLVAECGRSPSRALLPFVVLAPEAGARYNTIRTLYWGNIDFANRCLKFGKDKTASGTGRSIPQNQRAIETLKFWTQQFPARLRRITSFRSSCTASTGAKAHSAGPSSVTTLTRKNLSARFNPLGSRQRNGHSATVPTAKMGLW